MKVYHGFRTQGDPRHPGGWATITVGDDSSDTSAEPPHFHKDRIHPDGGLEWADNVSGQLRLAWDLIEDVVGAVYPGGAMGRLCGGFVESVVQQLPKERWRLTEDEIRKEVGAIRLAYAISNHDEAVVDAAA